MEKELFSPMAIDALGEMMNISLGSSATAVSNMLDQRVDITTPKVSVVDVKDFTLGELDPAMGVEIKYVSGLQGSNIMLLKRSDIKMIVDILMGCETPDEEFELNDLTISAVCELMNQMMGAAATALSDFLGYSVNISTPEPFELDDLEAFKQTHLPQVSNKLVVVRFSLKIENALESEFMNVMSVDLAKELISGLGVDLSEEEDTQQSAVETPAAPAPSTPQTADSSGGAKMNQEEIEKLMQSMQQPSTPDPVSAPTPAPAPTVEAPPQAPAAAPQSAPAPQQPPVAVQGMPPVQQTPPPVPAVPGGQPFANGYMGYPPMYYPPYPPQPPQPKVINTQPVEIPKMDVAEELGQEQAQNLDLIMEVPLQVTVEIGRTQRKVQDILAFSKGSLVVLDKLAGDQVDIFVNGKCIARGDVVVIDDNFGVRITEIVQKPSINALAKK